MSIRQELLSIEQTFINHFNDAGFEKLKPSPVIQNDGTTHFIPATVTLSMDRLLAGNLAKNGEAAVQECLRTQNLTDHEKGTTPEYMSFFTMCGSIAPILLLDILIKQSISLLRDEYGISKNNILLKANSADIEMINPINRHGIEVATDSMQSGYYQWKYGREELIGRGVTFAIKNDNNTNFRDIGNIIIIHHNQQQTAIEFGFGSETLLSRMKGFERPINTAPISEIISGKKEPNQIEILKDFLVVSLIMLHHGITPGGNKGKRKILKKYIQALVYWKNKLEINNQQLNIWAQQFCIQQFGSDKNTSTMLMHYLKNYRQ